MSSVTLNNEQQIFSQVATQHVSGNIYYVSDCNAHIHCVGLKSDKSPTSVYGSCRQESPGRLKRKRSMSDTDYHEPSRPPLFTVPYGRDHKFVSRASHFEQIHRCKQQGEFAALCGIGGAGKSQIAIEYAYSFHKRSHVLWVPASTTDSIKRAYQNFASDLNLPGHNDFNANHGRLVADYLGFRDGRPKGDRVPDEQWLIILDGLDLPEVLNKPLWSTGSQSIDSFEPQSDTLQDYLPHQPQSNQTIIITTRTKDIARQLNRGEVWIDVDALSLDQSRDMMVSKLGPKYQHKIKTDEIDQLSQKLGQIPLAISQAAAYIARAGIPVQDYLSKLEQSEHRFAEYLSRSCCIRTRAIFQTWEMSFAQIEREDTLAVKLLCLMAVLDGQQVPRQLLSISHDANAECDQAFGTLLSYSLISAHKQPAFVSIHNLVQASVRHWLRQRVECKVETVAFDALFIIKNSFPQNHFRGPIDMSTKYIMPHAWMALSYCRQSEELNRHRAELRLEMSIHEWKSGSLESAYELAKMASTESLKLFGEGHECTLRALYQMGMVQSTLTNLDEAELLLLRVLETRRAGGYPDTDRIIWRTLITLGTNYRYQGNLQKAEEILEGVFRVTKESFSEDSFELWFALSHLARALNNNGKFKEAEAMHRKVIARLQATDNLEHLNGCFCLDALGTNLRNLQKHKEAEVLHRQALDIADRVFEGRHPWKCAFTSNLARTLASLNQLETALEYQTKAVEDRESIMGKNNMHYWKELRELAGMHAALGRHDDAERVLRLAIEDGSKLSQVIEPYREEAVDDLNKLLTVRSTLVLET